MLFGLSSKKIDGSKEMLTIQKELLELAKLVIDDTIDRLVRYFLNKQIDLFKEKIEKAKVYKNGYILKLFLEKVEDISRDKNDSSLNGMIEYVKNLV